MGKSIMFEKIPMDHESFIQAYLTLTLHKEEHVLLESGQKGRYSIAGIQPFAVIWADGQRITIAQESQIEILEGNPLQKLEEWMQQFSFPPHEGLPDFQGGAIGYISYDYAWCIEQLPFQAIDDIGLPLMYFFVFDEWAVYDHEEKCLWLMCLKRESEKKRLSPFKEAWLKAASMVPDEQMPAASGYRPHSESRLTLTETEFVEAVEKIKEYIREGVVSQVNLTVRQSENLNVAPIHVYQELRKLNPSPYMGYFHTPEFQIVSGSPELLIKKEGQKVDTRPIGGTRPRGKDPDEDKELEKELLSSHKERDEHLMLVDIEINDLGKVCESGSVHVDELMSVEKYSHVMHIVSHVSGTLSKDKSAFELIHAVFPGGSITGNPKLRTMEMIEELEPVKRGVYTGSLGWIGFNGDLHLNIAIRTMIVKDQISHVQAGAGIVIGSVPEDEYKESLKKAAALWKAKREAENKASFL
ncbi:anthranilate synthase component I family protein [Siminovitchia sediminis]|uniref:Anthranilate synthase component I family protein n=1 Tax=Siminovitchia sediminis TaxID=1274353 RepID=A0ABW4KNH9_9BACI